MMLTPSTLEAQAGKEAAYREETFAPNFAFLSTRVARLRETAGTMYFSSCYAAALLVKMHHLAEQNRPMYSILSCRIVFCKWC